MEKFKYFRFLMIAMIAGSLITLSACDDDDDDDVVVEADKTELQARIQQAQNLIATTEEGTEEGQYEEGSQAELQGVIDDATAVYDDPNATQTQVDNATSSVEQAIQHYEGRRIGETPEPETLVGHWTFDEGEGDEVMDQSGNNFNGTFRTGHANWGGGTPEWTTDRHGNENQAVYFNQGAHIEVPYNAQLNPQELTISLWMMPDTQDEPWANNYMVSLNRWNGYKLQLQDAPKVFFTVKALHDGEEVYYDRDADPVLDLGEWYHVAVTFRNGEMTFYLDGTEVMVWEDTPGTAVTLDSPVNLTFGQDLPTDAYTEEEGDFYVNWGGYFMGALDEIRIYRSALDASQIQNIFEQERP
jgi:hypothetical protein